MKHYLFLSSILKDGYTVNPCGNIIPIQRQLPKKQEEFNKAKKKYPESTGKSFAEMLQEEIEKNKN